MAMWKKALQAYIWLYILSIVILIGYNTVADIEHRNFQPVALILPLLMFLPALVLFFELGEKKVSIIFTIIGLLIIAVPVAGIFNFNEMSVATVGKALIFLPMIVGLIYFGYRRLFHK